MSKTHFGFETVDEGDKAKKVAGCSTRSRATTT